MDQIDLNKINIEEWEEKGLYEEKYRLKLTSKHELVVGKWHDGVEWGVDLREWSYDLSRFLSRGITINSSTWKLLFDEMVTLHKRGVFSGNTLLEEEGLSNTIKIDHKFGVKTSYWQAENGRIFLSVNLVSKDGSLIWKATKTPFGIMIRFDTVHDLIVLSRRNDIAK